MFPSGTKHSTFGAFAILLLLASNSLALNTTNSSVPQAPQPDPPKIYNVSAPQVSQAEKPADSVARNSIVVPMNNLTNNSSTSLNKTIVEQNPTKAPEPTTQSPTSTAIPLSTTTTGAVVTTTQISNSETPSFKQLSNSTTTTTTTQATTRTSSSLKEATTKAPDAANKKQEPAKRNSVVAILGGIGLAMMLIVIIFAFCRHRCRSRTL